MPQKDENQNLPLIQLTSKEFMEFMETCIAAPMDGYPGTPKCLWGLPLLVEGEPGIAKTARIKQMAKWLQAKLSIFFAAPHPPESFAGALIPDGKGGAVNIVALAELRSIIAHGTGILFLDEVNGAAPATQGAIQSLIHERVTGGVEIPGSIRIVAAQNPEEIATGGFRLSAPVANRFVHRTDPGPSSAEWARWLAGHGGEEGPHTLDDLEEIVVKGWPSIYPEVQGLFNGFMERHGNLIHKRPQPGDPNSARAWASHRTWDYAVRAWTTARILNRSETVAHALIESCVGQGAAKVFNEYSLATKVPSPMEVLRGQWRINEDRLDIVMAAYAAATAYVVQRPDEKDRLELAPLAWTALWRLFEAKLEDIAVPSIEILVSNRLGRKANNKAINDASKKILVALAESGLTILREELSP